MAVFLTNIYSSAKLDIMSIHEAVPNGFDIRKDARLIVSPCRTGSTPLQFCFACNIPNTPQDGRVREALYQPIKTGIRDQLGDLMWVPANKDLTSDAHFFRDESGADYSPYFRKAGTHHKKGITIIKESRGPYSDLECEYQLFPAFARERLIETTQPLFLVRDPLSVYDAMKRRRWEGATIDLLVRAYRSVYEEYKAMREVSDAVACITYEQIADSPERMLRMLCERWGITYTKSMLQWGKGHAFPGALKGGQDYYDLVNDGDFDGITNSTTFTPPDHKTIQIDRRTVLNITRPAGKYSKMYDWYEEMRDDATNRFPREAPAAC